VELHRSSYKFHKRAGAKSDSVTGHAAAQAGFSSQVVRLFFLVAGLLPTGR